MPVGDAFSHLSPKLASQDLYLASVRFNKIYQKCIRRRVRAVLTEQIYSSPRALPAGHTGGISKGRDAGIGKICPSKPTWFDFRTAMPGRGILSLRFIAKRNVFHVQICLYLCSILFYYTAPKTILQDVFLIFLQRGRKNYAPFFIHFSQNH